MQRLSYELRRISVEKMGLIRRLLLGSVPCNPKKFGSLQGGKPVFFMIVLGLVICNKVFVGPRPRWIGRLGFMFRNVILALLYSERMQSPINLMVSKQRSRFASSSCAAVEA